MKRQYKTISLLLLISIINFSAVAFGESKYVSMGELRAETPDRWQETYATSEGTTVSVDIPIILPRVDKVPIVRITWGGPYYIFDETAVVTENTENHLDAEFQTTPTEEITRAQAPNVYIQNLKDKIPELQSRDFENYMLIEENSELYGKCFRMAFYSKYHGIPYLISQNFRMDVPSERVADLPPVPANVSQGGLVNGQFGVNLCSPKEIGIEMEDIPLLNFADVLEVFEKWIRDGYVYSLDEMRFGYMAFIDPHQKGKEYVLLPVWVAKGITRGALGMPFYPDEDPESLTFTAYMNPTVCAVNAQTGEKYAFVDDNRKDRRFVPHIITWNEV